MTSEFFLINYGLRQNESSPQMKKSAEATQSLQTGCSNVEPKTFAPPHTPSRGRRMAKI